MWNWIFGNSSSQNEQLESSPSPEKKKKDPGSEITIQPLEIFSCFLCTRAVDEKDPTSLLNEFPENIIETVVQCCEDEVRQ